MSILLKIKQILYAGKTETFKMITLLNYILF